MAVNVNSLGESVSAALTYSAEVMVGKVVLMQPRLNSMHIAEGNTLALLPSGYASLTCHCNCSIAEGPERHSPKRLEASNV